MIIPGAVVSIALFGAFQALSAGAMALTLISFAALAVGCALFAVIMRQLLLPRVSYQDGTVRVYLTRGGPIQVPIEFVECFFFSASDGQVPGRVMYSAALRNLVIRLAERAVEFHQRPVMRSLGRWEDGYIVIHGAWCEPLSLELVHRLNQQLSLEQRAHLKTQRAAGPSSIVG